MLLPLGQGSRFADAPPVEGNGARWMDDQARDGGWKVPGGSPGFAADAEGSPMAGTCPMMGAGREHPIPIAGEGDCAPDGPMEGDGNAKSSDGVAAGCYACVHMQVLCQVSEWGHVRFAVHDNAWFSHVSSWPQWPPSQIRSMRWDTTPDSSPWQVFFRRPKKIPLR